MLNTSLPLLACLTAVALLPFSTSSAALPSSTSASRQFIVYGADARLRGAICDLAEQTKSDFLHLLQTSDHWKTPVVIRLEFPQANTPQSADQPLQLSQLGYGLKLQLNLLVSDDLDGPGVQRQLLNAIVLEMVYRDRPQIAAGTPYVSAPDWLLDGALNLAPGKERELAAQLLQIAFNASKVTPIEQIVTEKRAQLAPPLCRMHDAYSMALVQLLIEAPGGRRKLAQFIHDLPDAAEDPVADLSAHFRSVLGNSAEKWWVLSVAQLAASDRYEALSPAATARDLDRVLRINLRAADGTERSFSLGEYDSFQKLPGHREKLRATYAQLLLLSARAHPCYRPIVEQYCRIAELLARDKTRKIPRRLARVKADRTAVERQIAQIDDYLNWYEATQLHGMSGAFSDYLRAAESSEDAPLRRRDPISLYLDWVEMEMP